MNFIFLIKLSSNYENLKFLCEKPLKSNGNDLKDFYSKNLIVEEFASGFSEISEFTLKQIFLKNYYKFLFCISKNDLTQSQNVFNEIIHSFEKYLDNTNIVDLKLYNEILEKYKKLNF